MRRTTFVLAFMLLALGAANASYVAHFPQGTAMLNLEKLGSEAVIADDGSATFPGHIGKYAVRAGIDSGWTSSPAGGTGGPQASWMFVLVDGAGESQSALAYEVSWLQEQGVLAQECSAAGLLAMKNEREPVCTGSGWVSCSIVPSCVPMAGGQFSSVEDRSFKLPSSISARANPPAPAGVNGVSQAGEVSGQPSLMAKSAATQAAESNGQGAVPGQAQTLEAQDLQGQSAAPQAQPIINAQQALPLAAALLAVVIISFLVLQQRQETIMIGPQDERLLENETRAGIMGELEGADRIPTDLSNKLGKSKATVVEHLETLVGAGFVERVATPGKKFVYYRLTHKGKIVLLRRAG